MNAERSLDHGRTHILHNGGISERNNKESSLFPCLLSAGIIGILALEERLELKCLRGLNGFLSMDRFRFLEIFI